MRVQTTATPKAAATYRVTCLPVGATKDELAAELKTALSPTEAATLTTTVDLVAPDPTDIKHLTALVRFLPTGTPAFLEPLNKKKPLVNISTQRLGTLTIDQSFLGLTPLTAPAEPLADLIVVHGLGGHPFGSFRSKEVPHLHWLCDFIPADFPRLRVLIFGYNSNLQFAGLHELKDYRRQLLLALCGIPRAHERPLLFLGHSYGGIVASQALVASEDADEDPALYAIHRRTRAMLFFGTPHRGIAIDDILVMVDSVNHAERHKLVHSIDAQKMSKQLMKDLRSFATISDKFKVIASFYEMYQTQKLKANDEGGFARTGEYFTSLSKAGATMSLPGVTEEEIPVDADHTGIVKFGSASDPAYRTLVQIIQSAIAGIEHEYEHKTSKEKLVEAAERGDVEELQQLVNSGTVRVDFAVKKGDTPLHLAARGAGGEAAVRILLAGPGGDKANNMKNALGRKPADVAKAREEYGIGEFLKSQQQQQQQQNRWAPSTQIRGMPSEPGRTW